MQKLIAGLKLAFSSFAAYLLGGFDTMLQMLCIAMLVDFFCGVMVALVFRSSPKTEEGALSSKAALKGLIRKVCQLLLVMVITRLSITIGDQGFCRNTAIIFFTANECISILENMGLMGVKYPAWLQQGLELLLKKNDSK